MIVEVYQGAFGTLGDITLFNSVWLPLLSLFWSMFGHPVIGPQAATVNPLGGIILFQFAAWLLFGRWMARNVALAMFDAANVKLAMEQGIDINSYRLSRARANPSYVTHSLLYENKGIIPPWSRLSVGLAGGFDCVEYYFGVGEPGDEQPLTEDEKLCKGGFALGDWDSSTMNFKFD